MEEAATPHRDGWDPLVKLTHWGIALAVGANALLIAEGSGIHIWTGYALGALLALRLLWGLIGPEEARFSSFPPSPMRALRHISDIRMGAARPHRSHNPLGALMVYALWTCLAVVVGSGIAMAGPPPADPMASTAGGNLVGEGQARRGSEAGEEEHEKGGEGGGEEGEEYWEEVHEAAVNLLYVLIALHVGGVVFESRRSGSGVVRAMLPGRMRER